MCWKYPKITTGLAASLRSFFFCGVEHKTTAVSPGLIGDDDLTVKGLRGWVRNPCIALVKGRRIKIVPRPHCRADRNHPWRFGSLRLRKRCDKGRQHIKSPDEMRLSSAMDMPFSFPKACWDALQSPRWRTYVVSDPPPQAVPSPHTHTHTHIDLLSGVCTLHCVICLTYYTTLYTHSALCSAPTGYMVSLY